MADVTVRPEVMCDFFMKFHLGGLPEAAVLHRFTDVDRGDPHDHPWGFTSHILFGGYVEEIYHPVMGKLGTRTNGQGSVVRNEATHIHRITEIIGGECWTLILPGPWEQKSGFWRFEDGKAFRRVWNEAEFRPVDQARAA